MICDHRTYVFKPGKMNAWLALYEEKAFPLQRRYLGEPIAFLVAETGQLNTVVHIWAFESAADREQRRAKMQADPEWQAYLKASADGGYMREQRTSLMTPTKFVPIKR